MNANPSAMTIRFPRLASLFCAISATAIVAFGSTASASSDLLANTVTAPVFASKDKVCVVSQNTGLAMWYNSRNHGFVDFKMAGRESGFSPAEELVFGADHRLAVDEFDNLSIYASDLGSSPMNQFLAGASIGFGAPTGIVFAKDGQLYLASRSPECSLVLNDLTGALVEATLGMGKSMRHDLKVLNLRLKAVPEPSSLALVGVAGLLLANRRRSRK